MIADIYLADEKIMIATATMVRAAATTPLIIRAASDAFSPPKPEHAHGTITATVYYCVACMRHLQGQ